MLSVQGGRYPSKAWPVPPDFLERYVEVTDSVLGRAQELAGGDALQVTQLAFLEALRSIMPGGLSQDEDDYARRVSLAVLQQGSNVFFANLAYLDACMREGRVYPAEHDLPLGTFSLTVTGTARTAGSTSLFRTRTQYGTSTIDLFKTTGVTWKIPKGFLNRYNPASADILRKAANLAGARHGSVGVAKGAWGKVTPDMFLEAVEAVIGELSEPEREYVHALATEQTPMGETEGFIHDLPYLDKCIQNGRSPSSIKGPVLLPTVFLNDTTSGKMDASGLTLRNTGGRIF